ncbi:hypothetical protein A260_28811, partial [Pseudomonas syringae pv. actinidiae ICMP 19068]
SVRGLADYEPQFSKLSKLVDYSGVKTALEIINFGHERLGLFSDEYLPVRDRRSESAVEVQDEDERASDEFLRLRDSRVVTPAGFEIS